MSNLGYKFKAWLTQVAIAFDQLFNALINGWADETLSARAFRLSEKGYREWRAVRRIIDTTFFWQRGHCQNALAAERERRHAPPPEIREKPLPNRN